MPELLPDILMAEDCADDAELTLGALAEYNLADRVVLGASALVVKPVIFKDFVDAVKTIGKFWGVLNVLRPGGIDTVRSVAERG